MVERGPAPRTGPADNDNRVAQYEVTASQWISPGPRSSPVSDLAGRVARLLLRPVRDCGSAGVSAGVVVLTRLVKLLQPNHDGIPA